MNTEFGRYVKTLRIDRGEKLFDMAKVLKVSPAFLSAVENGNKSIPATWFEILIKKYNLNNEQTYQLKQAIENSKRSVKVNLENASRTKTQTAIAFARTFEDMDDEMATRIMDILDEEGLE